MNLSFLGPRASRPLVTLAFNLLVLALFAVSANAQPLLGPKESLERVLSPKRSCPRCDLRGVDLSGRELTNINLAGADLSNANLAGATLDGASFDRANLSGARFDRASLKKSALGEASFSRANLTGASFVKASLPRANLQFATLAGTDFTDADLTDAIFGPHVRSGIAAGRKTTLRGAVIRRGIVIDRSTMDLTKVHWKPAKRTLRASAATVSGGWVCGKAALSTLTSVVYVAKSGTDSATCGATADTACASIAKGIERCAPSGCGVLVGWEEYPLTDPINLRDGVNLYGGCVPSGTLQAESLFSSIDAPPQGNWAIRADAINHGVLVQNFELFGSGGDANSGASSITVAVSKSKALTFRDVSVVAGSGGTGRSGTDMPAGQNGGDANGTTGGLCGTKQSGGHGAEFHGERRCNQGDSNCWGQYASDQSGPPNRAAPGVPSGYPSPPGTIGIDGANGAYGACADTSGFPEVLASGNFCCESLTWAALPAGRGTRGQEGGGGGGGAIGMTDGNMGGGGGGGGLGGDGGWGGHGGGPSFAMLLVSSEVTLTNCHIYGGLSGNGGRGGSGGYGGSGGNGGDPVSENPSGSIGGHGGHGGRGGAGSGGGGGNSGPSMLFALASSKIIDTNSAYYLGTAGNTGAGGVGGPAGDSCPGLPGLDGLSGAVGKTITLTCGSTPCVRQSEGLALPSLGPLK